ncbi:MAG: Crp/Fnr family transcriptional regulator [Brachymonas sp.]|nr:Crp/Fnr family transcriptional regulator [Brachymonas sp.]
MPEEVLFRISTQVTEKQFSRREVVLAKGQAQAGFGFLIEGSLQGVDFTVDGRSAGLYFINPGDFFGELSVIDHQAPAEHIIATAKSSVAMMDAAVARQWILSTPVLAQRVMLRLAQRVREATAQRTLLSLPSPMQRLCVQLLQLSRQDGGGAPGIDPIPTHQELAIMINSSRETVTRAFQVLALHQAIKRDGSALRLMRPDLLNDIGLGQSTEVSLK